VTIWESPLLRATALIAGLLAMHSVVRAAQEQSAVTPSACQVFGQVFDTDSLDGDMLVKTPSGSMRTLRFDENTVFTVASFDAGSNAAPARLKAEDMNVGDWICARGAAILVARRQALQQQQKDALTRWLRGGAFGTVIELNANRKSVVLDSPTALSSTRILVNTSEKTRFRCYGGHGTELTAISPASWEQLRVGDRIYVHGTPSADAKSLNSTLIISGGLDAIGGSIAEINPLEETVRLKNLNTEQFVTVHIGPGALNLINPNPSDPGPESTGQAPVLQTIDFGDIGPGDSVIVLGRQVGDLDMRVDGLALIVNFGRPLQSVTWELMPVTLGLP
jgi:hypothetical protein